MYIKFKPDGSIEFGFGQEDATGIVETLKQWMLPSKTDMLVFDLESLRDTYHCSLSAMIGQTILHYRIVEKLGGGMERLSHISCAGEAGGHGYD